MALQLGIADLELIIRKYVSEHTPITCFYRHDQIDAKLSGYMDSVSSLGMVVRNDRGEFLRIELGGAAEFQMGDERDAPAEVQEFASRYSSSLCFRLPNRAIVALFEDKPHEANPSSN